VRIVSFRAPTNPIHLALVVGIAMGGCFEDPPVGEDVGTTDASGASEAGSDAATSLADETATIGSAVEATSNDTASDDGSTSVGEITTDSADSTTGDQEGCECPPGAALCEDFEAGLDALPWEASGDPVPIISDVEPRCGLASLSALLEAGDMTTAITGYVNEPKLLSEPYEVRAFVRLSPACISDRTVRAIRLAIGDSTPPLYTFELDVIGDGIGLRCSNTVGAPVGAGENVVFPWPTGEWLELAFGVDLSRPGVPRVSVAIDATQASVDCPAADTLTADAFLQLGATVEQVPALMDDCTVDFDAVSLAPASQ
jgi:hypothetical protein